MIRDVAAGRMLLGLIFTNPLNVPTKQSVDETIIG
jgi:hypothetical protein